MLLYPNWPVLPNTASEIRLACCGKNGITFNTGLGMQKATAFFTTKAALVQLSHNFSPPFHRHPVEHNDTKANDRTI
jgi:hypothetical protein